MSNYARVIHHATSILCGNKGSMDLVQLYRKVYQRFDIKEDDFWYIVKKCPRFAVVKPRETAGDWGTDCIIVAKTSLRLCKNYSKQECADCQELHLCKYFVYGNCRYGKGRWVVTKDNTAKGLGFVSDVISFILETVTT